MRARLYIVFLTLPVLAVSGAAQVKAKKPAAKAAAPPIAELVLRGRTPDAVKAALKSPAAASAGFKQLLSKADLEVTNRQIPEATQTLAATEKFVVQYIKRKGKGLAGDSVAGRKLRIQAIQLNDKKEYGQAADLLKKALDLAARTNDRDLEAGARNNLGFALQAQSSFEEAAAEFEKARKIAEDQQDSLRAGSYNFNLGQVLIRLRKMDQAYEAFKRSAEQNKAAGNASLEARALLFQGVSLSKKDPLDSSAVGYLEQARSMFESQKDHRNAAWSLMYYGDHIAYSQRFADAAQAGEKAAEYFKLVGDKPALEQCYEFVQEMFNRAGDLEKVAKYKKLASELK